MNETTEKKWFVEYEACTGESDAGPSYRNKEEAVNEALGEMALSSADWATNIIVCSTDGDLMVMRGSVRSGLDA